MHKKLHLIYTTTVPIRWADLDEYGHVNHAQILVLLQEARLKWLNDVSLHKPFDVIFPIVEAHVEFRKALSYPGNAIVKLLSEDPSKKFWILHHELYFDHDPESLYASAWIRSVCVDRHTKKTIAIPEAFKKAFYPH